MQTNSCSSGRCQTQLHEVRKLPGLKRFEPHPPQATYSRWTEPVWEKPGCVGALKMLACMPTYAKMQRSVDMAIHNKSGLQSEMQFAYFLMP